jgi:hypothetical protein
VGQLFHCGEGKERRNRVPMRWVTMLVFLDFEASSLNKRGYPIEVGWIFEDGRSESHLIRPAPDWTDWDSAAQAIHHIHRPMLFDDGEPHEQVANRMVEVLDCHDILASAPSWDGKWLSALLRASGLPRHRLRLRDSDDARRETASRILAAVVSGEQLADEIRAILALADVRAPGKQPAHRALADAMEERALWLAVYEAAATRAKELSAR